MYVATKLGEPAESVTARSREKAPTTQGLMPPPQSGFNYLK